MFKKILFIAFILICLHKFNAQQNGVQKATNLVLQGELNAGSKLIDSILQKDISLTDKGFLYLRKATIYRLKGENTKFLEHLKTVFEIAEKIEDKILYADALMQKISYLNNKKGKGLADLAKYVALAEATKNNRLIYNANIALASYSLKGNNPLKARIYYKKAVLADVNNKNSNEPQDHLDLIYSNILNREEKYDSAVFYLKKVLLKTSKKNQNGRKAQALSLLGNRSLKTNDFENSFKWSLASYKLATKTQHKLYQQSSYVNMFLLLVKLQPTKHLLLKQKVHTFFKATSFKEAVLNAEKKLPEIRNIGQKIKLLKALHEGFKALNNFEKALFYNEKWSQKNLEKIEKDQLNVNNFLNLEILITNLNKAKKDLEIKNQLNIKQIIILILSIITLSMLCLFIWSQLRLKIKQQKLTELSLERDLLKSTKKSVFLEKTLEQREIELNSFIRDMIEKNSQIEILEQQLKDTKTENIEELKRTLKNKQYSASKNWLEFMFQFNELHPMYLKKLKNKVPTISPTETKLSILTFLNLSSKEIGSLLGISASSVNQGKYRLKKKMKLEKTLSLYDFLQEINQDS